jgi:hypothetical protein
MITAEGLRGSADCSKSNEAIGNSQARLSRKLQTAMGLSKTRQIIARRMDHQLAKMQAKSLEFRHD